MNSSSNCAAVEAPVSPHRLDWHGQEADRKRTDAAGFDGHLVKSVEAADLLETVNRPWENSGHTQEFSLSVF